jgi:hypothetical protein
VINTVTGKTFVGELLLGTPWSIRLRRVTMPGSEGDRPLDGTVHVSRRVVEFVQVID